MKKMKKMCVLILAMLFLVSCGTGQGNLPTDTSPATSQSPSVSPGQSVTPSPTASVQPDPTATQEPSPSPSQTASPTAVPSASPTSAPTPTPFPTHGPGDDSVKDIPVVKGIFLSENNVSDRQKLDKWIQFARDTEINSFIINVKNDSGYIVYDSQNPTALEYGAVTPRFNVKSVTDELHENGIYAIARIVCFKDDVMGEGNPGWALKKTDGTNYRETVSGGSTTWINIANEDAGRYMVEIAKEVLEKGFDEVQFDYIRFPGNGRGIDYSAMTEPREFYVSRFVDYAIAELDGYILSADIFGITCIESYDGGGIGQTLSVFRNIDVISPMIYPSHYANSSKSTMGNGVGSMINGTLYEKPDLEPYGVVYDTLVMARRKIESAEDHKAIVRPFLQGFTASYLPSGYWTEYDAEKFRLQIQAVYDAGYDSWIFWDSSPSYTTDLFYSE